MHFCHVFVVQAHTSQELSHSSNRNEVAHVHTGHWSRPCVISCKKRVWVHSLDPITKRRNPPVRVKNTKQNAAPVLIIFPICHPRLLLLMLIPVFLCHWQNPFSEVAARWFPSPPMRNSNRALQFASMVKREWWVLIIKLVFCWSVSAVLSHLFQSTAGLWFVLNLTVCVSGPGCGSGVVWHSVQWDH